MSRSKSQQSQNQCIFCGQQYKDIFLMMNDALKAKYIETNQKHNPVNYIDCILKIEQPENLQQLIASCKYRQYLIEDEQDQFLKRQYSIQQYNHKISTLSEYYKFHNDIPKVVQYGVEKIMGKYYDKKREFDYKKIKKVLKQEQGLSITSVQNSISDISHSQIEKKSKYSTLLHSVSMNNNVLPQKTELTDSKLLLEICSQIDHILPSDKNDNTFHIKGTFNDDKLFDYFLQKSQNKIQKKRYQPKQQKTLKKFNLESFMKNRQSQQKITTKKDNETIIEKTIKKQKNDKFVYNTNVKIQIRNAMFYSEGKNQVDNEQIKYDYKQNNNKKVDSRFKKKNLIIHDNPLNKYKSNQKILAEVYKSSQHDLRLKNLGNINKLSSKNNSQSRLKEKRRSESKPILSQNKKKTLSSVSSARKILIKPQQWLLNRQPIKSMSTQGLRKSSGSVRKRLSSFQNKMIEQKLIQKRPIQTISQYGSSQMKNRYKPNTIDTEQNIKRKDSIKQLLKRKLKFKIE